MRRWLIVTAGLAAAVLLADTLLWVVGSRALAARFASWTGEAQAHGWIVSAGERNTGGWPFAATLTINRAGIAGGERVMPGGLTWSADRVIVSVSLAHPLTLRIAAEGQEFLRVSHLQDLGFTAAQAIVRLPLVGRRKRATLYAAAIGGGVAGSRHPQDVQIAAVSLLVEQESPALPEKAALPVSVTRVVLQMEDIGLPDIGRWPLGATIARAAAAVALSSPAMPNPVPESGEARTAAWRDGGGKLTIQDARLHWGPLSAIAQGVLGLDGRLQPSGAGTADIVGAAPALDAASHAGLVAPGLALTAQALLAVMAHVPGPDGTDAVRLPFQCHDNTISVGEIPVVRVPGIVWRGGASERPIPAAPPQRLPGTSPSSSSPDDRL